MRLRRKRRTKRHYNLKTRYGLTLADFDKLAESQDGLCWICADLMVQRGPLNVDHDHATGQVRGLLCHHCNLAIANLRESPHLAARASEYLRMFNGDRDPCRPSEDLDFSAE